LARSFGIEPDNAIRENDISPSQESVCMLVISHFASASSLRALMQSTATKPFAVANQHACLLS
jgi:hypothetical protein